MDTVHARPVEFVREVGVEHRFLGLQRHALVDERSATDTGGAQGRHVLADARLDQTGVGLEGEVATEHLGVRPVPQEPLVGVVDAGEGVRVRSGGPPDAALEHVHAYAGPGQPQGGHTTAETGADDDHAVFLVGERHVVHAGGDAGRCVGTRGAGEGESGGRGRREHEAADGAEGDANRGFWGRLADVLPASGELERYAYRLNAVGFLLWTFTLVAGAIWAEQTWGRPWDWDPKEVGTFVVWVTYAAYLHARATRGWDGRKAAYLGLSGFAIVIFNFAIVNVFFNGLHAYSGLS